MRAAKAARGESFAAAEGALKQTQAASPALTREDLAKMIDGLAVFAKEQLLLALDTPLRRLVGLALQGLNRPLDVPRNLLVGLVGEIPAVGGIIAAVLNIGLGIVVDLINQGVIEAVRKITALVIGDVVKAVTVALKRELLKSKESMQAAAGFAQLAKIVAKLAGGVKKTLGAAAAGQKGLLAQVLVNAVTHFITRGVRDPDIRTLLSRALETLSAQSTSRAGGFTLTGAVAAVLRAVARPLGQLVSRRIQNPRLKTVVAKGIASLLGSLANAGGAKRVMANPLGFLTAVGKDLVAKLKPDLVEFLTGKIKNPTLRAAAARAVDQLVTVVTERGFSALMGLSGLLAKAKAKLASAGRRVVAGVRRIGSEVATGLRQAGRKVVRTVKQVAGTVLRRIATIFEQRWRRNCRTALPALRRLGYLVSRAVPGLRAKARRVMAVLQRRCLAGRR